MTALVLALSAAGIAIPAEGAAETNAVGYLCIFNGFKVQPWQTMTLEEAEDRIEGFSSFCPKGCHPEYLAGNDDWYDCKSVLMVAEDDPRYLQAREDHRKVYQALERTMKAKGIEPQTPESYAFIRSFRPMNYPETKDID